MKAAPCTRHAQIHKACTWRHPYCDCCDCLLEQPAKLLSHALAHLLQPHVPRQCCPQSGMRSRRPDKPSPTPLLPALLPWRPCAALARSAPPKLGPVERAARVKRHGPSRGTARQPSGSALGGPCVQSTFCGVLLQQELATGDREAPSTMLHCVSFNCLTAFGGERPSGRPWLSVAFKVQRRHLRQHLLWQNRLSTTPVLVPEKRSVAT